MKFKKPSGSKELFETGDIIVDVTNPKRIGKIVRAGPQQSEVKWTKGPSNNGGISVEINKYLKKRKRIKL